MIFLNIWIQFCTSSFAEHISIFKPNSEEERKVFMDELVEWLNSQNYSFTEAERLNMQAYCSLNIQIRGYIAKEKRNFKNTFQRFCNRFDLENFSKGDLDAPKNKNETLLSLIMLKINNLRDNLTKEDVNFRNTFSKFEIDVRLSVKSYFNSLKLKEARRSMFSCFFNQKKITTSDNLADEINNFVDKSNNFVDELNTLIEGLLCSLYEGLKKMFGDLEEIEHGNLV